MNYRDTRRYGATQHNTFAVVGGNSDHLAIITTKLAKEIIVRPAVIKKRSYKYFKQDDFLQEV